MKANQLGIPFMALVALNGVARANEGDPSYLCAFPPAVIKVVTGDVQDLATLPSEGAMSPVNKKLQVAVPSSENESSLNTPAVFRDFVRSGCRQSDEGVQGPRLRCGGEVSDGRYFILEIDLAQETSAPPSSPSSGREAVHHTAYLQENTGGTFPQTRNYEGVCRVINSSVE